MKPGLALSPPARVYELLGPASAGGQALSVQHPPSGAKVRKAPILDFPRDWNCHQGFYHGSRRGGPDPAMSGRRGLAAPQEHSLGVTVLMSHVGNARQQLHGQASGLLISPAHVCRLTF